MAAGKYGVGIDPAERSRLAAQDYVRTQEATDGSGEDTGCSPGGPPQDAPDGSLSEGRKGLLLNVYRAVHLDREYGDPTYGGITARHDRLVVVGTICGGEAMEPLPSKAQVYEVSGDAPAVVLVENREPGFFGPSLVPLQCIDPDTPGKFRVPKHFVGPVAGGNFAGTADLKWLALGLMFGDGRSLELVPVHDRIENMWKYQTSTAGKSNLLGFWDYDKDAQLTCPECGWTGRGDDHEEFFLDVLDVSCPNCDYMVLVVAYPTLVETRVAAAAGDRRAQAALPEVEAAQSRASGDGRIWDAESLMRLQFMISDIS